MSETRRIAGVAARRSSTCSVDSGQQNGATVIASANWLEWPLTHPQFYATGGGLL